jgi:hypothetical protein
MNTPNSVPQKNLDCLVELLLALEERPARFVPVDELYEEDDLHSRPSGSWRIRVARLKELIAANMDAADDLARRRYDAAAEQADVAAFPTLDAWLAAFAAGTLRRTHGFPERPGYQLLREGEGMARLLKNQHARRLLPRQCPRCGESWKPTPAEKLATVYCPACRAARKTRRAAPQAGAA